MDQQQQRVEMLVKAFRESLNPQALEQISEAQFEDLTQMIREAIAEELNAAARVMEEALLKIRAQVEKPELGL
jgi:hypothetical protein